MTRRDRLVERSHRYRGTPTTLRRGGAGALLVLVTSFAFGLPGAAAAQGLARFSLVVNGQSASTSSDAHPARINPNRPAELRVTVTARTSAVRIATVRFEGDVMDLPLFSYDSTIDLDVPPHTTRSVTFPITVTGIGNQATGLVMATATLVSPTGTALGAQSVVTTVSGSLTSLYGLFGLAVLALTVSSLFLALLAMARHRLAQNRWLRAVRFLIPGFGVGLVLIFTTSVLGIFDPGPGHWLPLLIISSAVGLAFGYLTPAPDEEEFDDYDPNTLLAEIQIVDDDTFAEKPVSDRTPEFALSSVVRPMTIASGFGDQRATIAPAPVPDSRGTIAPDPVPDSRGTIAPAPVPDSRGTIAPSELAQDRPEGP